MKSFKGVWCELALFTYSGPLVAVLWICTVKGASTYWNDYKMRDSSSGSASER